MNASIVPLQAARVPPNPRFATPSGLATRTEFDWNTEWPADGIPWTPAAGPQNESRILPDVPDTDAELFARAVRPFRALARYCRLHVEGIDNIPTGPAILVANHTGCFGLDYANAAVAIHGRLGRPIRGLVHPAWFRNPRLGGLARRLGLLPVSRANLDALLARGETVLMFPEGEAAAFKPMFTSPRYEVQEFHRGFVRAAMTMGAPIVPVAIVGGEEANPILRTFRFTQARFGLPFPLPASLLPLPVKWRIKFLRPLRMTGYRADDASDRELVHEVANSIRADVQRELRRQVTLRGNPVF